MRDHVIALLPHCRSLLDQGEDTEAVIRYLRAGNCTKVDTILALHHLGVGNMREAKMLVHNSETWRDRKEQDEQWQKSVLDTIAKTARQTGDEVNEDDDHFDITIDLTEE